MAMRSLPTLRQLSFLLMLAPALTAGGQSVVAAEEHAPAQGEGAAKAAPAPAASSKSSAEPGQSPWEHPLWANATTMMRIYICDHARRPPHWCGGSQELPGMAELPDAAGPPLIEEDARWLAFLEKADPNNLSLEDVATIRLRAIKRRDPQAMEILGFLYAEGGAVARDYKEAYRWYGLAYLAGETRVRPNMDVVWQQLQRHDLEGALALTREFNALADGEVPESLKAMFPEGRVPAPVIRGGAETAAGPVGESASRPN